MHPDALECFRALSQVEKDDAEHAADEAEDDAIAMRSDVDDECAIFEDDQDEVSLYKK